MLNIITVCFNDLSGLKSTYKSIATYLDNKVKWIVIDGNSTDGTKNWLSKNAETIHYYSSEKDEGLYFAMNKGIEAAEDGWLWFLNAGDLALNSAFEIANTKLSQFDLCYGDAMDINKGKRYLKKAKEISQNSQTLFTHHQSIFYNKRFIDSYRLRYDTRYKIAADYDFTCRFFLNGARSLRIDAPVCVFDTPRTSKFSSASFGEWKEINMKYYNNQHYILFYCKIFIGNILKRFFPNIYYRLKNYYAK